MIGGIAWTGLLIGAGIWATGQGLPILWIFIGPWLIPGVLLAIWGFQAPPEEPPRP